MAKPATTPLDTRSTSPERAVQPLVQTDTPRLISPKNNPPIATSTSKAMAATVKPAEWKEVTMSASFKDLHTVAFPIIQFLLQQPVNRDHPFRTEWNDYLDCGKGITENSSFYAVKMITGIKNIDDYKNLVQKCPQLQEYLAIKRADPKYSSKIIFRVLKLPSKAKERIDVDLATKATPSKAKKRIDVDLATKETPVDPSATIRSVNAPAELPPSDTDKGPASSTSRGQLKATGDIPKTHVRISLYPNNQSFEKFLYQAYPYITSWCTDNKNCNTVFAQKWNRAIEHGLSPLSPWEFVFELLEIKFLHEFCQLICQSQLIQDKFDLIWDTPYLYYLPEYIQAHADTQQMDNTLIKMEETITQSTARLDRFISTYSLQLQNISSEIKEFSKTVKYRAQAAYDRVHDAGARAIIEFKTTINDHIAPTVSHAIDQVKDKFEDMTYQAQLQLTEEAQKRLNEADAIYDDIFEHAVNNLYETAQEVIEQILEHKKTPPYTMAPSTTASSPPNNAPSTANLRNASGDVREWTGSRPGLMKTPWARDPSTVTLPPEMKQHPVPVAITPGKSLTSRQAVAPTSSPQLDHHKFIKYVEVTYNGNIFAFYNKLQNFGHKWGLALIPLRDIRYGKSLCPEYVQSCDYLLMAQALYEKLQKVECIPYAYTSLRHTLNRYSSSYDGYKALYDILEDYVPCLKKDPEFPEPVADDCNSIHDYANQFNAYLTFEELSDPPRIYSPRDQIQKFIRNLGSNYSTAVSRVELLLASWQDPDPPPRELELHTLPKMIENYTTPMQGIIRAAAGGKTHQSFPQRQGAGGNQKGTGQDNLRPCSACHIPGHYASECHALGKFLLLSKFKQTADERKLQQAMDNYIATIKPPRMKRSQLKATIRTLLDNNQLDEIVALFPKEEYSDDEHLGDKGTQE
jgi:hypothetical protein